MFFFQVARIFTLTPGFDGFLPGFLPFDGFFFFPVENYHHSKYGLRNVIIMMMVMTMMMTAMMMAMMMVMMIWSEHPLRRRQGEEYRPAPLTTAS